MAALRALLAGVAPGFEFVRGERVRFLSGVVAHNRPVIRGPGRVVVGDRANLLAFAGATPLVAGTPKAVVAIAENARLNGPPAMDGRLIDVGPDQHLGGAGATILPGVQVDRCRVIGCRVVMASAISPGLVVNGTRARVLQELGKLE